jgi:hypothetical protein
MATTSTNYSGAKPFGVGPVPGGVTRGLYLWAGQSNDIGQGLTSELSDAMQEVQYNADFSYEYWLSTTPGPPDVVSPWGPMRPRSAAVGAQVPFAYTLTGAGFRNASIEYSIAGSSLNVDWPPRFPEMYTFLDAQAAIYVHPYVLKAFIWIQGENDATNSTDADAYQTNLTNLVAAVRAHYGNPSLAFICALLHVGGAAPFTNTVRAAEQAVAAVTPNFYLIDIDDTPLKPDNTHWTTAACVAFGQRAAAVAATL